MIRGIWGKKPSRHMRSVIMLFAVWASLPGATIATFDGTMTEGPTCTLDGQHVSVGGTTVALTDCDWIEPGSGGGTAAAAGLGVWLVDGSWLPATAIAAGDADHTLLVTSPFGRLRLPLTAVRGWSATAELPSGATGDTVLLDGGPVQGQVDGIIAGKLVLRSALSPDKPLELPLDQVRGLRLAVEMQMGDGVVLAAALAEGRSPLRLRSGPSLTLAAAPEVTVGTLADAPLRAVRWRIEGGRRRYLSDLTPSGIHDEGAFGVVWPWQRDRALDGTPLRLAGVPYAKGISAHSVARLTWALDGRSERLRALAGIADQAGAEGDCTAVILGDGRELWRRDSVKGGAQPIPLDFDCRGVKILELRVEMGARFDIGDQFTLADAWLVQAR
jgi:hypothetical protein